GCDDGSKSNDRPEMVAPTSASNQDAHRGRARGAGLTTPMGGGSSRGSPFGGGNSSSSVCATSTLFGAFTSGGGGSGVGGGGFSGGGAGGAPIDTAASVCSKAASISSVSSLSVDSVTRGPLSGYFSLSWLRPLLPSRTLTASCQLRPSR